MRTSMGSRVAWCLTVTTVAGAALAGCAPPPPESRLVFPAGDVVDLSHAYGEDTVFWPTAERFHLEVVADGMTEAGFYYAANNFSMAEHGGTHLDAPVHFAEGRHSVDQIPLEHLIGPAAVVDVRAAADLDPDYQVSIGDLETWEREHGPIPDDAILLLLTGYSSRWPDAERYLGTAERGEAAVPLLHFPGLHPDAARWLVENRRIGSLGIDTASIDYGQSTRFESHRILYERDIPAFENLAALDRLPAAGAFVVALPMKIAGGSGAPVRAIGIVPPSGR